MESDRRETLNRSRKNWLPLLVVMAVGFVVIAAIAVISVRNSSRNAALKFAAPANATPVNFANQDVDPGTSAGDTPAPNFQLRDQLGRKTSLAQFRGKVVLIAFVDSQCTTICPLTTESMVEALRLLGPAAADVQLLGINANPLALKVSDVASYTRAHQMQGRWRFLTGSLPQLKQVWREYHVYVSAINNDIDHQPAMVLIDTLGRESKVYMTQMSYEGVAPQAQLLADDIAKLLPGLPTAAQEVPLKYVPPLQPSDVVKLTPTGAHKEDVVLGGLHAHLLLFFAGWLDQNSALATRLGDLDRYRVTALRKGWPSPVAVDELTTESFAPNASKRLAQLSAKIRTPLVEDSNGRLGDGYQVEDLPWYSLTSPAGKIIWSHDGWLSLAALERQVHAALAKSEPGERSALLMRPRSSTATGARANVSASN
jgi:cytochrome oxidase Cu insertion factor (SCO1/SenC/PrrC family)